MISMQLGASALLLSGALGSRVGAPRALPHAPRALPRALAGDPPPVPATGRGSVVLLEPRPSGTLESLESLQAWLRGQGAYIDDGIEFDALQRDGRGVFLSPARGQQRALGTPLLQVPVSACITEHTVLADPQLGEVMRALLARSGSGSEVVPVVAFVLRERARGRASAYWQYLESLPWDFIGTEQVSPLFWTDVELQRLEGSRALREAIDLRAQLDAIVSILFPVFRAKRIPVIAPAGRSSNAFVPLSEVPSSWFSADRPPAAFVEAVREAFALVLSRRLSLPGISSTVLVPLIDRLSYAPSDATAQVEFLPATSRRAASAPRPAAPPLRAATGVRDGWVVVFLDMDVDSAAGGDSYSAAAARAAGEARGGAADGAQAEAADAAEGGQGPDWYDSWELDDDEREMLLRAAQTSVGALGQWSDAEGTFAPGAAEGATAAAGAAAAAAAGMWAGAEAADRRAAAAVGAEPQRPAGSSASAAAASPRDEAGDLAAPDGSDGGGGGSGVLVELSHCYNGCTSNAELLAYYGLPPQALPPETCRASVVLALDDPDPYGYAEGSGAYSFGRVGAGGARDRRASDDRRHDAARAAKRRGLLEWKRALLADVGLSAERQEFEIGLPGEPFHVPPDLLGYLRLAAIAEPAERDAVDRCDSPWQLLCGELCFIEEVPVSEEVDREAARRLEAACKKSLAAYDRRASAGAEMADSSAASQQRAASSYAGGITLTPIEQRSEAAQRSVERAVDAARLVMSEQLVLRAAIEMLDTFSFRWLTRCSMMIR